MGESIINYHVIKEEIVKKIQSMNDIGMCYTCEHDKTGYCYECNNNDGWTMSYQYAMDIAESIVDGLKED